MLRHLGGSIAAQSGDSDRLRELARTREDRAAEALEASKPLATVHQLTPKSQEWAARMIEHARRKGIIKGGERG